MSETTILRIDNVSKVFGSSGWTLGGKSKQVHAVSNASLTLDEGEVVGLVGESGSGKSTLGRIAIRLIEPTSGAVWYRNQEISNLTARQLRPLRREMQPIFQDPYASLNPRIRIGATIAEGMRLHGVAAPNEIDDRVAAALRKVGMDPALGRRYPRALSGGQRQRIAIARALSVDPKLIVADEPVSALDVSIQAEIIDLLAALSSGNKLAMLFISHDLHVVRLLASRIVVLYLGHIVEEGPTETVFKSPRHPYTAALLASMPAYPGRQRRQRSLLQGELPNPMAPPSGCVFHPRCAFAVDACKSATMKLTDISDRQRTACIRTDVSLAIKE